MSNSLPGNNSTEERVSIGIVGATGVVGEELIRCIETSNSLPKFSLHLFASSNSIGKRVQIGDEVLAVKETSIENLLNLDLIFFAASSEVSKLYIPRLRTERILLIDCSSAYRTYPKVPLVVPEVNFQTVPEEANLFSSPNCIASILTVALNPIQSRYKLGKMQISTYQAASGGGLPMMKFLTDSTSAYLNGTELKSDVLPFQYGFNFFSHNSDVDLASLHNGEELKIRFEVERILELGHSNIGVTSIRVPVLRAHGISVTVELDKTINLDLIRDMLKSAPSVQLVDNLEDNIFPMPITATNKKEILVGRIRKDFSDPSGNTLSMFIVGDQLLKGAALNAVQIAERILS